MEGRPPPPPPAPLPESIPRPMTAPDRLARPPLPTSSPMASPPRQGSRSSRRLSPLGADAPASPSLDKGGGDLRLPSPLGRLLERQPLGHLGMLWGMRRSEPSPTRSSWASEAAARSRSPGRPLRESASGPGTPRKTSWGRPFSVEELHQQRPPLQDVRMGHRRRPSDLGDSPGSRSGQRPRGRSCAAMGSETRAQAQPASTTTGLASGGTSGRSMQRCSSVPPTGTAKADGEAAAQAKAKAVALLKRYFAEEMAKGGQDANEAAARALRRLNEAPREPGATAPAAEPAPPERGAPSPGPAAKSAVPRSPGAGASAADAGASLARGGARAKQPSEAERSGARRPSPVPGRLRRPSPMARPTVRS